MRYRHLAPGALAGLLLAACGAPTLPPADLEAPQVVSASPEGSASTEPTITIVFSEPMDAETLTGERSEDTFALVPSAVVDSSFLSDFNSPPLISSRKESLVPGVLTLSADRQTLTFVPSVQLEGDTSYTYLVSPGVTDLSNNPIVVRMTEVDEETGVVTELEYEAGPIEGQPVMVAGTFLRSFFTGAATDRTPPQIVDRVPAADAANVPPNITAVQVTFDEPVVGATASSFFLETEPGGAQVSGNVLLSVDRQTVTLELTSDLAVSTTYRMVLTAAIRDLAGNPIDELASASTFTTATCLDTEPPVITDGTLEASPIDVRATITWRTNEPSSSVVRFGPTTADTAVSGPWSTCAGTFDPCATPTPDADCEHSVTLTGLTPETDYVFVVESEDASGNLVASAQQTFRTTEPLPVLVLNEIMANPDTATEEEGEYLEIYNAGTELVDLADAGGAWTISETGTSTIRTGTLETFGGQPSAIGPGEYALIVGQSFDLLAYPDHGAAAIVAYPAGKLFSVGASNSRGLEIELIAPQGAVISTFGGWVTASREGTSIERQDPAGPDEAGNWSFSDDPTGGTPGLQNSVTP